jgi:hypothetical protein
MPTQVAAAFIPKPEIRRPRPQDRSPQTTFPRRRHHKNLEVFAVPDLLARIHVDKHGQGTTLYATSDGRLAGF